MNGSVARQTFVTQYAAIRSAEGRGSEDPEYYQSLPYIDITGRNDEAWRIRARSFDHFVRKILTPLEGRLRRPLHMLDLGAGNGWMSWRLMQRGHHVMAVDIFTDRLDGLGAIRRYAQLDAIAADFDQLPVPDKSFDLVIYNASLHYSPNYARTLKEARRCVRPDGRIVVLDSPVYRKSEHGERMRSERQSFFERTYGFRSEALGSIEYLDEPALATLARVVGVQWQLSSPWYGWRWAMRPVIARLRGKRPPSRFFVISGRLV